MGRRPFAIPGAEPEIAGVTWVDDLGPFIERKLFTVNTAHAAAAYHGHDRGWVQIREALATPELQAEVRAVLDETKTLLVEKHGFDADEQQAYIEKTLKRISNPDLPDSCERVGRNPLRKLSRHERFIGPAAELVERGHSSWDLLNAIGAALRFDVPDDSESVELQALLASATAAGGPSAADIADHHQRSRPVASALSRTWSRSSSYGWLAEWPAPTTHRIPASTTRRPSAGRATRSAGEPAPAFPRQRRRMTGALAALAETPEPTSPPPGVAPLRDDRAFGALYLALTVGWILGVQFTGSGSRELLTEILWQFGEFTAIVSAPLWFGATLTMTRWRSLGERFGWLALGSALLFPWPLLPLLAVLMVTP